MAEFIQKTDTLNQGREKLNAAITDAEKAKIDAGKAVDTSGRAEQIAQAAENKADSVQAQFDQVVIEGDSSVEAAAARVDEKNETHPTLKARIDDGFMEVSEQLADIVVNAKIFGATGDGVFDNTAVLQTALESTINKILFFPAGEYNFTNGNVLIENMGRNNGNRIHVRGEKGTKFIYTKEDKTHTNYVDVPDANCIFEIVDFDTVILEKIELEGNTTYDNITGDNTDDSGYWGAVWGVKLRKNNTIHIEDVAVHGFNYRGIAVNDDSDPPSVITKYMYVNNSKGYHNRGSGFWVNNVDKLFISNSEFFDDGLKGTIQTGYGFACSTKVNHCFVDNCYFHHSWGKGLDSHGFGNLTVRNSTFEDMGKACIGWGYPSAYLNECHIVIENNTFISGFTSEGEQWLRELHQANAANGFFNRQGMLHCRGNAKVNAVIEVKNNTFLGCYNGWDVPVVEGNPTISDNRIIMLGEDDDTGVKGWSQVIIEGNIIRAEKYKPYSVGSSRGGEMLYIGRNTTEATIKGNQIIKATDFRMSDGVPGCVLRSYYDNPYVKQQVYFYDNVIRLKEGYLMQTSRTHVSLVMDNNKIEIDTLDTVKHPASPYYNELDKYGIRRANTDFSNNKILLSNRKLSFAPITLTPFNKESTYVNNPSISSLASFKTSDRKRFMATKAGGISNGENFAYIYLDNAGLFDLKVIVNEGVYNTSLSNSQATISSTTTSLTTSTTFNKIEESDRFNITASLVEFSNIRLVEVRLSAKTSLPADLIIDVEYEPRVYVSYGILATSNNKLTTF